MVCCPHPKEQWLLELIVSQVLYLEWVQELGFEHRELGVVHRMDSSFHWQWNANRS
jgi:hypothetical protein